MGDRLSIANKSGGSNYNYDRYGNRWQQKVNGNPSPNFIFNVNNNRINSSGYSYDALGKSRTTAPTPTPMTPKTA